MKISAVVLTKNEEKNIDRCLRSLSFCDEVIVIDDFSTDKTIVKVNNALKDRKVYKVLQRGLKNDFASQRNFGLKQSKNDWVLFIDADEMVSDGLKSEINKLKFSKDAYFIKRRDFFWGREMKHGETGKTRGQGIVRLVKKTAGRWMGNVHEIFHTAKNCGTLIGFLDHYPHQSIKAFLDDVNFYSTIRAQELFNEGKSTDFLEIISYPLFKFVYTYFILLGFLDGPSGFVYSFFMSFHSFLVRAKLYQYKNIK